MMNSQLLAEQRPYLLIGIGRWGSMDTWLGIPVTWEQIAGARAIVETGIQRDVRRSFAGIAFFPEHYLVHDRLFQRRSS